MSYCHCIWMKLLEIFLHLVKCKEFIKKIAQHTSVNWINDVSHQINKSKSGLLSLTLYTQFSLSSMFSCFVIYLTEWKVSQKTNCHNKHDTVKINVNFCSILKSISSYPVTSELWAARLKDGWNFKQIDKKIPILLSICDKL